MKIKGCPNPIIDQEIVFATRELCEKSKVWKTEESSDVVIANQGDVALTVDATNADIVSIDYATYDGFELTPTTIYEMSEYVSRWREHTGTPTHYITDLVNTQVRLYPIPTTTNATGFVYSLTLKPSESATTIEDFIVEQFLETIVNGALSRLYILPANEWTDGNMAMYYDRKFKQGIDLAKFKAMSGFSTTLNGINSQTLV